MTTKNMTSATKKILVPQFKEKIALRNTAIWLALFFAVYAIIGTLIRLYPPEFDKQILLWANPDEPILGLDEFFIIITNFSIPLTATVGIWSFIAFNVIIAKPEKKEMMNKLTLLVGGIISLLLLIFSITNAWDYEPGHNLATYIIAPVVFLMFIYISHLIQNRSIEDLRNYSRVLLMMVIAGLINILVADFTLKRVAMRPRPLQEANADWNFMLRMIPDGITRTGYSFPSGHSTGLFVLLTPMILYTDKRPKKVALFLFGAIHAFIRIYLFAHFPTDIFFGSLSWIIIATIVFKVLFKEQKE